MLYLPRSSRKHAPPPLVPNHAKTWQGMGGIGKNNIGGQPGLVRVDSKQLTKNMHVYSLKKHTICQRARWSAAHKSSSYKIKNGLISL
jgi:hypothetical protein